MQKTSFCLRTSGKVERRRIPSLLLLADKREVQSDLNSGLLPSSQCLTLASCSFARSPSSPTSIPRKQEKSSEGGEGRMEDELGAGMAEAEGVAWQGV